MPYTYELYPENVIKAAQKSRAESIAYTYSEPITFSDVSAWHMIDQHLGKARLSQPAAKNLTV